MWPGRTAALVVLATLSLLAVNVRLSASTATEEIDARVASLLSDMTDTEKRSMLNGLGWDFWDLRRGYYIGNTPPIPRLDIPSLNMQDAGQGFRTEDPRNVGRVTSWSCALGLASVWDPNLVYAWASAVAEEFKAKHANVILGPGLNVHRVARGGRNAEYMSGEDPYLGVSFAGPYVRGFQDHGVLTVMKHFGLNNQETNRNTYSANVDARTAFEVYHRAYQACVDNDVAAAMCSYNVVNGTHACSNEELLTTHLKRTMGFEGFVMSDWGAVHDVASLGAGLDQDMPGSAVDCWGVGCCGCPPNPNASWFSDDLLASQDPSRVDDAVARILKAMIRHGVMDETWCAPPNCDEKLYGVNATSEAHRALALEIATKSVMLLKNERDVLPLRDDDALTVAVVGSACDAPNDVDALNSAWDVGNAYVVGGSGRVIPPSVRTVLDGIRARVRFADVEHVVDDDVSLDERVQIAMNADVVVTCGFATTTESRDRDSLRLDQEDTLTEFLTALDANDSTTPIVLVLMLPGPVTLPFLSRVDSVVGVFLAGQSTGDAIAATLFGDHNPRAKSPVTFPVAESDVVAPCEEEQCDYVEGRFVGYRGLEDVEVTFPFGHGLSYSTATYAWSRAPRLRDDGTGVVMEVSIEVSTPSNLPRGVEVVQLYYRRAPSEPIELKRYASVEDTSGVVSFELDMDADLSYWNVTKWAWTRPENVSEMRFYVGASSRDVRLESAIVDHGEQGSSNAAEVVVAIAVSVGSIASVALLTSIAIVLVRVFRTRKRDGRPFDRLDDARVARGEEDARLEVERG